MNIVVKITPNEKGNPPVDIAAVTAHFNVVARQEAPLLDAVLESGAIFVP
jgi:hypothetical protein